MTPPLNQLPATPQWLAVNEAKQKAYEAKRAEWRELVGVADTNL
jgi:hypothetical protein